MPRVATDEAEGEGLEDARIVRVGLEQALDRHAVFERCLRVLALVDGARRVGDGVAEAFALRGHEQQLLDGLVVAPGEVEAAGVASASMMPRCQSSMAQAIALPVEAESRPRSLRMLFRRSTCSGSRRPIIGPNLPSGDVLGAVALVVLVELAVALDAVVGAPLVVVDVGLGLVVAGVALEPHQRGANPSRPCLPASCRSGCGTAPGT